MSAINHKGRHLELVSGSVYLAIDYQMIKMLKRVQHDVLILKLR